MALYAFDGTGNEDRDGELRDSNVLRFFEAYVDPKKNTDPDEKVGSLYLNGIGVRAKEFVGKAFAEAFGVGGHERVKQALKRLEHNLEAGDRIVDVVGFSRGAALAMSFANRVKKEHNDLRIRFVGVFDVVGQFGLPGEHIQAGHVLSLPDNVDCCRHAMAMDESRALFPLTRLCDDQGGHSQSLLEVWFRGVHSDIGGGNGNRALNWIALQWMFVHAKRAGLPISEAAIAHNLEARGLPGAISHHKVDASIERKYFPVDRLHASVVLTPVLPGYNNPTFTLKQFDDEGNLVEVATRPSGTR
jgi:uncharacterized protein (DUF2235 family)